jgi:FixJ family two-component response regulator
MSTGSEGIVAIVDDEETVRKALERLLRSAGLMARTFASGSEFLSQMPELILSCIVLDLHMPGVSGFGVMESVPRSLPIVVITGHDSPEARQRSMASGASAYLRKPVDECALLEAIRAAITHGPDCETDDPALSEP